VPAFGSGRIGDETLDGTRSERVQSTAAIDKAAGIFDANGVARIAVEQGVGIAHRDLGGRTFRRPSGRFRMREARPPVPRKRSAMRLTIDGTTYDYLERGHGPAVVLLHPFGLRKEIWAAQLDALAAHARVVALDLRGMGDSDAPPGPYLMESLAGDVAGVMDALRIERAIVVGHSYSVAIAYEIFRMYAERVSGLVLICGRAAGPSADAARTLDERANVLDRENDARTLVERASGLLGETTRRAHPEVLADVEALLASTSLRGAAATLRGMAMRVGAEDLLPDITVQTLRSRATKTKSCRRRRFSPTSHACRAARMSRCRAAGISRSSRHPMRCATRSSRSSRRLRSVRHRVHLLVIALKCGPAIFVVGGEA